MKWPFQPQPEDFRPFGAGLRSGDDHPLIAATTCHNSFFFVCPPPRGHRHQPPLGVKKNTTCLAPRFDSTSSGHRRAPLWSFVPRSHLLEPFECSTPRWVVPRGHGVGHGGGESMFHRWHGRRKGGESRPIIILEYIECDPPQKHDQFLSVFFNILSSPG